MKSEIHHGQSIALLITRLAIGMLFVWWGAARISHPEAAAAMSDRLYSGFFATANLQIVLGGLQALLGAVIVLGIKMGVALPILLAITLGSIVATWKSILDPFALWLAETNSGNHGHYINAMVLSATLMLMVFGRYDRLRLGSILARRQDITRTPDLRLSVIPGGMDDGVSYRLTPERPDGAV